MRIIASILFVLHLAAANAQQPPLLKRDKPTHTRDVDWIVMAGLTAATGLVAYHDRRPTSIAGAALCGTTFSVMLVSNKRLYRKRHLSPP